MIDEGWWWQWGGPSLLNLLCPCRRAAGTRLSLFMKGLIERPQPIRLSWNGHSQDGFDSQFPTRCLQRAGAKQAQVALTWAGSHPAALKAGGLAALVWERSQQAPVAGCWYSKWCSQREIALLRQSFTSDKQKTARKITRHLKTEKTPPLFSLWATWRGFLIFTFPLSWLVLL